MMCSQTLRMKGWEAIGIDPYSTPFEEGRARLLRGTVSDVFHSGELFDAATMFDMIEHVPDYLTLIQQTARLVKPGGVLVIATCNYQSLGRLRRGRTWWSYQTDHRWYLAPSIVKRQLGALGFQRITLCDRLLRAHWKGRWDSPPSWLQTIRAVVRRPWKAGGIMNAHRIERAGAARWPEWYHMGMFALAATKPTTV
jgi:SAM-dependent methyltransferase